jgi:protein involved in polysaccharide export with SLBB domain
MDFVEEYKITIDGEIKKGIYDYYEGLTLNDLLVQAGGLTGSASKGGSARMIMSEEIDDANPKKLNCLILKLLITMNNLKLFVVSI